jgi:uncharacterized membrane protein
MRCPRCDFENTSSNTYCENCGTNLIEDPQYPTARSSSDAPPASSPNQVGKSEYVGYPYGSPVYNGYAPNTFDQQQYTVPPPPPSNGHNIPIAPPPPPLEPPPLAADYNSYGNFGTQSQVFENQKVYEPQPQRQSLLARIIRGCIYFFAVFVAGFGAFAAIDSLSKNNMATGIGIALLFGLLIAGIVVFFLVRRFQHIRFLQFLLGLFVSTGCGIVALILVYAIFGNFDHALPSFLLSIILLLYGLILAALALW